MTPHRAQVYSLGRSRRMPLPSDMQTTATSTAENERHVERPQSEQPTKSSKQRFKPQLSCTFCRSRKLKCDRQLPCENCVKRNSSSTCTYVHGQRERSSQIQKSTNGPKDVQSQVRHLEELVISLMNKTAKSSALSGKGQPPITPDGSSVSSSSNAASPGRSSNQAAGTTLDTAESFGRMEIEDDQFNYVDSTHWAAILDNISLLKDRLGAETPPKQKQLVTPSTQGPDLLVGSVRSATRAEILAALPSRSVVDALVAAFIATPDMGNSIFHVPTFMKEYENFWVDASALPIMWIGLLFCILSLSVQFWVLSNKSLSEIMAGEALKEPQDVVNNFREKTVQCLVLGNYTEPGAYTVETLLLYYISDHFRTSDAQFGSFMMFGLIVRAAMRLGFHRDASHFPKVSAFKGELQRRIWHMIVHLDLINSLQVGLPRMIRDSSYDTQEPRNLLDEDFDEHTAELPPARSSAELSSIVYMNAKHRITHVFGNIVDQSNSTNPISYEEVMRLDKILHDVHQQLPGPLQASTVDDLNTGLPQSRIRKFSIDLTFQKARCVLHRKWFYPKKSTAIYPYPYSMKACIEASMRILQTQMVVYGETAPNKALYDHKWKTSSLITNDFLLAAMLLCLYLGYSLAAEDAKQGDAQTGIRVSWARDDMLQALQGSYLIWEELSPTSKDASKAAKALKYMLDRVGTTTAVPTARGNRQEAFKWAYTAGPSTSSTHTPDDQSVQNFQTPGGMGTQWMTPPLPIPPNLSTPSLSQLSQNMSSGSATNAMELDWGVWDSNLYNANFADGDTPPELWNFDTNFPLEDPNTNIMRWDQQL